MARSLNRQAKAAKSLADELAASVLNGDLRAVGRVLSFIDDRDPVAKAILKRLYARTGGAHIVGITGSAGSGKSTLIGCLTTELRRRKKKVGILTIDPTSPFSGGAVLGDRIRMRDHFLDKGVFIRSMATRGSQGGLSSSVYEAAQLLDAMGQDYILIETIGIGQDQIQIRRTAHTVLVIVTPDSGDEIQGMKAGVLEIADLLVINKADLPGAEELFMTLGQDGVPTFKTSAIRNEGIAALVDAVDRHRVDLVATGNHKQRTVDVSRSQLMALIHDGLMRKVQDKTAKSKIEQWAQKVASKESDPYTAAETILRDLKL